MTIPNVTNKRARGGEKRTLGALQDFEQFLRKVYCACKAALNDAI